MTVSSNTIGRQKVSSLNLERSPALEPAITPIYARKPIRRAGLSTAAWMLAPTLLVFAGLTTLVLTNPRSKPADQALVSQTTLTETPKPALAVPSTPPLPLSLSPTTTASTADVSNLPPVIAPSRRAAKSTPRLTPPVTSNAAAALPEAPMAYDGSAAAPAQNTVTVPPEVPSQPADPAPDAIPAPLPAPEILTEPNM
jgi:hypothetical protein